MTVQPGLYRTKSETPKTGFLRTRFKYFFTASSLLRQLNPAIDPCEDFHGFVCDKYVTYNAIPDDDIVKSWRTDIRDLKIRKLASK